MTCPACRDGFPLELEACPACRTHRGQPHCESLGLPRAAPRVEVQAPYLEQLRTAASMLVGAVDDLGGVECVASGMLSPLGEPRLYGVGDAYLVACGALGRAPLIDGEHRVRRLKF